MCTAALAVCLGAQYALAAGGNDHHEADTSSHGGDVHHAQSSAGLPQLDATTFPSQLFWLFISFAVLYFIFSKKSLPEISNIIESRQEHIEGDLATAEDMKQQAEQVQKAYESSLEQAREKATDVITGMQESMKARAEKENEGLRAQADKDIEALEKSIDQAKKEAMDDMHTIAAEVAAQAAQKIVGISADAEQVKSVIKEINGNNKPKAA
jgi:F-type H+-transporting ATPase subunit b